MKIPNNILSILADCRIEGKWNRKDKDHVFDYDSTDALENLILIGESIDTKKALHFFPTPREVAELMCNLAKRDKGNSVLEPSIDRSNLADGGPKLLQGVELNPEERHHLADKPYLALVGVDILLFAQEVLDGNIDLGNWSHIIMNALFARQQDIDHVYKAYKLLCNGGILVSVMGSVLFSRTNKKSIEFRHWLDSVDAEIQELPEGMLKASGTNIRANIIKIRK